MDKKLNSVMKFTIVSEVTVKMYLIKIGYISVPTVIQNFLIETASDLTRYF